MSDQNNKQPSIVYSCYANRSREGEQFVAEHVFSYQESGKLILDDGNQQYTFQAGDFRFARKNHLVKFNKLPPEGGEFKSLAVYLDQETLRNFSIEYGYKSEKHEDGKAILELKPHPLYKGYINSVIPYQQMNVSDNNNLTALKLKELLLLLLQVNPELKNILFDFSEPGKIDLEAFMNKNYHFNVELKRFAYLTGRSLATFKRDFEKIFNASPSRWLLQKRLQEAHHLIRNKGAAASDIYLDLGFEDLSHFSFAFKKMYGISPSKV
ncbi:MAG: helix-turn-helix transcriptional regulator [Niastella sp.]|nr:helix-turn-helix transcriptional regulator [Niastella sp.]